MDAGGRETLDKQRLDNAGHLRLDTAVPFVMTYERITSDPARMGGVPCIRDLRFPVATVLEMVADGMTVEQILNEHPDLEAEDVRESLRYAADAVTERELPLRLPV
jgi:uncharacterized protein (DUF433 family)